MNGDIKGPADRVNLFSFFFLVYPVVSIVTTSVRKTCHLLIINDSALVFSCPVPSLSLRMTKIFALLTTACHVEQSETSDLSKA